MRLRQAVSKRDPRDAGLQGVHGEVRPVPAVHQHTEGTQVFAGETTC